MCRAQSQSESSLSIVSKDASEPWRSTARRQRRELTSAPHSLLFSLSAPLAARSGFTLSVPATYAPHCPAHRPADAPRPRAPSPLSPAGASLPPSPASPPPATSSFSPPAQLQDICNDGQVGRPGHLRVQWCAGPSKLSPFSAPRCRSRSTILPLLGYRLPIEPTRSTLAEYVNMTADELREWLETEDSQSSGWSKQNDGKVRLSRCLQPTGSG